MSRRDPGNSSVRKSAVMPKGRDVDVHLVDDPGELLDLEGGVELRLVVDDVMHPLEGERWSPGPTVGAAFLAADLTTAPASTSRGALGPADGWRAKVESGSGSCRSDATCAAPGLCLILEPRASTSKD
jgi:hypothetical protein